MTSAIHLKKLATEQFCRPGRSAMDSSVLQRCTLDHFQYRGQCFSLTSCDLANCYDRIVHTAAALALLRLGVSHTKICSMFHSIQKMIHRVRTAFGDSEQTYGGEDLLAEECPPQGVLQVNAAGSTIWSIISPVIFDCLHARGHSIYFCSSLSRQLFTLVRFMYVDDCNLFQCGSDPVTVLESMQSLINSWGSLVQVIGRCIETNKSWWYLVDFVWHRGSCVTMDPLEGADLQATTADGSQVSLRYLCCHEAAEMLGL